jgi:EAL and modified HD-GYP domain-containing signal transduction protein
LRDAGTRASFKSYRPTAFLVGLFSLLDALLEQSMPQVMKKLPLGPELKAAWCDEENTQYLLLIKAYEIGRWKSIQRICAELQVNEKML